MTSGPIGAPVRRTVAFVVTAIGLGSFVVGGLLIVVGAPDVEVAGALIRGMQLVSGMIVAAALAFAIGWRSRVASTPTHPQRYLSGTLIAAAVSEAGFLGAVIAYLFSPDLLLVVGSAILYVAGLLILLSTTRTVDLGGE